MTKAEAQARFREQVVAIVATVPEGRVTTYGLIARHLHAGPRQVAKVLATLTPAESVALPWYRVVAANGVLSSTKAGNTGRRQKQRLRVEGVAVTPSYKVEDFAVIVWTPTS